MQRKSKYYNCYWFYIKTWDIIMNNLNISVRNNIISDRPFLPFPMEYIIILSESR